MNNEFLTNVIKIQGGRLMYYSWSKSRSEDHIDRLCDKVSEFSAEERQSLEEIIQRLKKGEPVQYILERADFCGHTFKVAPVTRCSIVRVWPDTLKISLNSASA